MDGAAASYRSNAIIIPLFIVRLRHQTPVVQFVTVTIGEILSCGVLGMLLLLALQKHRGILFPQR